MAKAVKEETPQVEEQVTATKVTYSIEDMNQVLSYLGTQRYGDVAGLVEMLKAKGEFS